MTTYARESIARERFSAALLAAFAAVAVLLAAVGIYGVMAYVVARRGRELGVRAALGATPRDLFGTVMWHGLRLAGIGSVLGLAGAVAAGRLLERMLFGIGAADPATLAAALAALPALTITACALPARRAARVDPLIVLRAE